jgi:hypothetical protein
MKPTSLWIETYEPSQIPAPHFWTSRRRHRDRRRHHGCHRRVPAQANRTHGRPD